MLDSKKDVDRRLKAVCEQFIADTSQGMLRSVMELNSKVNTFQAMGADKQAKLSSQPWADTNIITTAVAETVKLIKQNVGQVIYFVCERFMSPVLVGSRHTTEDAALPGQQ